MTVENSFVRTQDRNISIHLFFCVFQFFLLMHEFCVFVSACHLKQANNHFCVNVFTFLCSKWLFQAVTKDLCKPTQDPLAAMTKNLDYYTILLFWKTFHVNLLYFFLNGQTKAGPVLLLDRRVHSQQCNVESYHLTHIHRPLLFRIKATWND